MSPPTRQYSLVVIKPWCAVAVQCFRGVGAPNSSTAGWVGWLLRSNKDLRRPYFILSRESEEQEQGYDDRGGGADERQDPPYPCADHGVGDGQTGRDQQH